MGSHYGAGTIVKRGNIWYVTYWVDGRQKQKSSHSDKIQDAKNLRDQLLGQKGRGEIVSDRLGRITCGELLDDVLRHVEETGKASTSRIWKFVIERKDDGLPAVALIKSTNGTILLGQSSL